MKRIVTGFALAVTIALTASAAEPKLADAPPPLPGFPKFKVQEIATDFKIGYAVHIADVNGDDKPDIVVVDKERVVWYENPTWKVRTITQGKTKPDNVCICSLDIDGDKKIDFVLGAGWKPMDTKTPGTLQWLRRGKTLDDEWEMFPIPCDEPLVHRIAAIKNRKTEEYHIIVVPLMGRGATKEKNWIDGKPVNILDYKVPKQPTVSANWKSVCIDDSLHVIHNFAIDPRGNSDGGIYFASYEGITGIHHWQSPKYYERFHVADQTHPTSSRGASEIARAEDFNLRENFATVEPWHGNSIVAYEKIIDEKTFDSKVTRSVIDRNLRWGHAVKYINYIDSPFIVAGVRDNPDPKQGDKFTEKRGVRLYRATDAKGEKWERYILEDGGVAVEDLAVHDLNGDGKPDIIAVGRATQNCRIYWNQGK